MKRAIFVDRDGTIIREPADEQVDSLAKLSFVPGAISGLKALTGLGYEIVLATNQDGRGTEAFPEEDFMIPHQKMLEVLEGEGVVFDDQLIDPHFPADNHPDRKPGTGMFGRYMDGSYDLAECFVIGDRATDIRLAHNLGAKGILFAGSADCLPEDIAADCILATTDWRLIAETVRATRRCATIARKTSETDIFVRVDLDGMGESQVDTGLKFFDHMLTQLVHHGGLALAVRCKGDLEVDEHHTIEDVGIALGEAVAKALGDKRGIERYGFVLPMDECAAMVLIDFGGRAELVWDVEFTREYVGDVPVEMFKHFFKSLSTAMRCNLCIKASGENNHHLAESIFKAFARAVRQAVRRDVWKYELPSSKGLL